MAGYGDDAGRYFPIDEGRTWTYRIRAGEQTWTLATRKYGGDVRSHGTERVPYQFVYGRPGAAEDDRTKSIYAEPSSGVEEFYVDGYHVSVQHDPPVPLLKETRVGATWSWSGTLGVNRVDAAADTRMTVVGRERVSVPGGAFDALRIEERAADGQTKITRWFVRDVGLAKLEVQSEKGAFVFELMTYSGG